MADYNIMITSVKAFNCSLNSALKASEDHFRSTREQMNLLQQEFEQNYSKGLNLIKENSLNISLKNDELKNELANSEKKHVGLLAENKSLKKSHQLVESFVEAWKAKHEMIDPNNNDSMFLPMASSSPIVAMILPQRDNQSTLEMQIEELKKENQMLQEKNVIHLRNEDGTFVSEEERNKNSHDNKDLLMQIENKKLYLKEVMLMDENSNLRAKIQAMKKNLIESGIVMKEKPILNVDEHPTNIGPKHLSNKKESHSKRTQRILKGKVNEMRTRIVESERCLENYAKALGENEYLSSRADEIEKENASLKVELETLKAEKNENNSKAEKESLRNISLISKIRELEKEIFELKEQLIQTQSQMVSNTNLAVEKGMQLQEEKDNLNEVKKEQSFILAHLKEMQALLLDILKSGACIHGYNNTVEITTTLPEITELVHAFDNIIEVFKSFSINYASTI